MFWTWSYLEKCDEQGLDLSVSFTQKNHTRCLKNKDRRLTFSATWKKTKSCLVPQNTRPISSCLVQETRKFLERWNTRSMAYRLKSLVGLWRKSYSLRYTENTKTGERNVTKVTAKNIDNMNNTRSACSAHSNRWLPCIKYEVSNTLSTSSKWTKLV